MDNKLILNRYNKFNKEERIRFFLCLSHKITIIARDAYSQNIVEKPAKLIKANEFQHRVIGFAIDLLDDLVIRTAPDIVEYLLVGFSDLGTESALNDVITYLDNKH